MCHKFEIILKYWIHLAKAKGYRSGSSAVDEYWKLKHVLEIAIF